MCGANEQHGAGDGDRYELVCKGQFARICGKLDRIDEVLRGGNGRPGLQERVHGLERTRRSQLRLVWIAVMAALTTIATSAWDWLRRGGH
jgi:hypothetical protein